MEVLASNKTSAEIKVDGQVTLYFTLTEKGVWRSSASTHCRGASTWVEPLVFADARKLATEAIASHYFTPMNTEAMVKLVLSSLRLHKDVDVAVEAIFASKIIPPYDFLKLLVGWGVKKELGAKLTKRAEGNGKQQAEIKKRKKEKERQLVLSL